MLACTVYVASISLDWMYDNSNTYALAYDVFTGSFDSIRALKCAFYVNWSILGASMMAFSWYEKIVNDWNSSNFNAIVLCNGFFFLGKLLFQL